MRAASVKWHGDVLCGFKSPADLIREIRRLVEKSKELDADIIVFPAFTGCYFEQLRTSSGSISSLIEESNPAFFIDKMLGLSEEYHTVICPGSYWEKDDSGICHKSCAIDHGKIVLDQKQIYLAKWERDNELSRGDELSRANIGGMETGIVLSTDIFYPQVSRMHALNGAELVLSPAGFVGKENRALQVAGMWREVQQNLFFAVESGFNGRICGMEFWADSAVHAPLEMTEKEDGFLVEAGKSDLVCSILDKAKREKAVKKFDTLARLNRQLYLNHRLLEADG